ncbi:MAG: hypothetical protein ACKVS7_07245 [Gemmatimonadaceae bacterium]
MSIRFCERCGSAVGAQANFCANCGASIAGAPGLAPAAGHVRADGEAPWKRWLPWILTPAAMLVVIGIAIASRTPAPPAAPEVPTDGIGGTAPDISSMTPEERVDRLFNRVMAAAAAGKKDSVAFFAPMAANAFLALDPLTSHRRYDLGLIYLVGGDPASARAQADTILRTSPQHLLGLALAMRASSALADTAARQRFATIFLEKLPGERARRLQEYIDHETDIDEAIEEAEGRRASSPRR